MFARLPCLPLLLALAGATPSAPPASTSLSTPEKNAAAREEIRYLALGDSFTEGTGSPRASAFPVRLAAAWRRAGHAVELLNLGANGYTTEDLLEEELPQVAAFKPTRVTLAVGANDIVHGATEAEYRAQLKRIFEALRKAGVKPSAVVALPQPEWSRSPSAALFGSAAELGERIERFNAILREETEAAGGRYVDLSPLMRKQAQARMVAADGLHPSAKAYGEWADALENAWRAR